MVLVILLESLAHAWVNYSMRHGRGRLSCNRSIIEHDDICGGGILGNQID